MIKKNYNGTEVFQGSTRKRDITDHIMIYYDHIIISSVSCVSRSL